MTARPEHTMLDIETFGTTPGAVIRSIGAVTFSLSGETGSTFYVNVDRKSCEDAGLFVDPATERWWSEQSEAARKALLVNPIPLKEALQRFTKWFVDQQAPYVWAHGANFDPPLLEAAYVRTGGRIPWKFWNVRDTRTVFDLFKYDTRDLARNRVHHNALDDTLHQVDLIAAALRKGRQPEPAPQKFEGVFE